MLVRLLPGNIIDLILRRRPHADPRGDRLGQAQLGLVGSYPAQYVRWPKGVVHGDFGLSLRRTSPSRGSCRARSPIDIELILLAVVFAMLVGIPLGAISAIRRDKAVDYVSRVTGLVGISIPNFWLATLLLDLHLARLPLGAAALLRLLHQAPGQNLQQFLLPAISISRVHARDRDAHAAGDDARGDRASTTSAPPAPRASAPARDRPARAAQRAHPGRDDHRLRDRLPDRRRARSSRPSSTCPGWATRSCRRSTSATTRSIAGIVTILSPRSFIVVNLIVDLLYGLLDPRILALVTTAAAAHAWKLASEPAAPLVLPRPLAKPARDRGRDHRRRSSSLTALLGPLLWTINPNAPVYALARRPELVAPVRDGRSRARHASRASSTALRSRSRSARSRSRSASGSGWLLGLFSGYSGRFVDLGSCGSSTSCSRSRSLILAFAARRAARADPRECDDRDRDHRSLPSSSASSAPPCSRRWASRSSSRRARSAPATCASSAATCSRISSRR